MQASGSLPLSVMHIRSSFKSKICQDYNGEIRVAKMNVGTDES